MFPAPPISLFFLWGFGAILQGYGPEHFPKPTSIDRTNSELFVYLGPDREQFLGGAGDMHISNDSSYVKIG